MKIWKRIGYVSVELVITAALIMAVGFFLLLDFGTTGSQLMQSGMNKLDALGIFGGGGPVVDDEMEYDENGYPKELNINPADINPVSDFDFVYSDELAGWVVVKYNNATDMDIIVPRQHSDGRPIVGLGGLGEAGSVDGAFEGLSTNTVALPLGITWIGEDSLKDNGFTSLIIPDGVTTIGAWSISGGYLESVTIPDSVVEIGTRAFYYAELVSMEFKGELPATLGTEVLYNNDFTIPSILVPAASLNDYRSNATAFGVAPGVFFSNLPVVPLDGNHYDASLGITDTDINAEEDFEYMWNAALKGWTVIDYLNSADKDVVIPAKRVSDGLPVVAVGYAALSQYDLTSVALPNTLISIADKSFELNSLSSIIIPDNVLAIGNEAFEDNVLTSVTLGKRLETIGEWAFSDNLIQTLNFGESLYSTGYYAFYESKLTSLTLPSSVKVVSSGSFSYSYDLTTVTLPEGLESIELYAFTGSAITAIDIPSTVTYIGEEAFSWNQIASIDFSGGNPTIGDAAFTKNKMPESGAYIYKTPSDTQTLVSYAGESTTPNIPLGTKIVGRKSFKGIPMTTVSIPESVTVINASAFEFTNMTSVTLPSGLTFIGNSAFSRNKLTSVVIPNGVLELGEKSFAYGLLVNIEIPDSVTTIGTYAFADNPYKTLSIGSGVTSIGSYAFGKWITNDYNGVTAVTTFKGPVPTTIGSSPFYLKSIFTGDIKVPAAHLAAYQAKASAFGVAVSKFSGY